jgi:hypothetical protein
MMSGLYVGNSHENKDYNTYKNETDTFFFGISEVRFLQ